MTRAKVEGERRGDGAIGAPSAPGGAPSAAGEGPSAAGGKPSAPGGEPSAAGGGPRAPSDAVRDLPALRERLAGAPDGGALQPLGLGAVELGPQALAALRELVTGVCEADGARPIVLLADATPMRRAGADLKAAVADALGPVHRVEVGDSHGTTHADEPTIAGAERGAAGAACLVSVGSGTVVDVGKAVAARLDVPHVAVQTAASVNGFADDQSVLLVDGVKRTTPTAWPAHLVIDTTVLTDAPPHLAAAGLGDMLATFTAPADWYLARAVGQDPSYSDTVVALTHDHGRELLALGGRLHEPESLERLAALLTLSGLSMGVAGRTAPGSGMEHTVSHLIEMAAGARGEPSALHGAKVGVCTVLAAITWRRVRRRIAAGGLARLRFPDPAEMGERVREAFAALDPSGAMGEECARDYARKLERWNQARPRLEGLATTWPEHDERLAGLLADPADLVATLGRAGAPLRFSTLGPPVAPDLARWALRSCHLMRDRFTVADLAFLIGAWEDEDVEAVLAEAGELGAGL